MNEFKTCNKCRGFNSDEIVKRLKELDSNAKIIVGCQSMCAIGSRMPFVIVNGIPVMDNHIDNLITKVKGIIK